MKVRGPLAVGTVLTLAADLAEALAALHAYGLVHRDLKPSNILLDDVGPHLIDLGCATDAHGLPPTTRFLVGAPTFMAPEQILGREATPSSDMFALGATMVFAATGRPLVPDGARYSQLLRMSSGQFDLSALPDELRSSIGRCVSLRPADRPTAAELLQVLPVAKPPGPRWLTGPPANVEGAEALQEVNIAPPRQVVLRRRVLVGIGLALSAAATGYGLTLLRPRRDPRPGDILWHARSSTGLFDAQSINGSLNVIVDRGQRIITADGSLVRAFNRDGVRIWTLDLPAAQLRLVRWNDAVLVTNGARVWLLDPANGRIRFMVDVTSDELSHAEDNPDGLLIRVRGIATAGDLAFLNLGTALAAIDQATGKQRWRVSRREAGTNPWPTIGDPTGVGENRLLMR